MYVWILIYGIRNETGVTETEIRSPEVRIQIVIGTVENGCRRVSIRREGLGSGARSSESGSPRLSPRTKVRLKSGQGPD